jgi:hypothetical protein
MNIDLSINVKSEDSAIEHYLTQGINEKRLYKMSQLFDVNFFIYSGRNSSRTKLDLSFTDEISLKMDDSDEFFYKYGQSRFSSINETIKNNAKSGKPIYIVDVYRTPLEKKISCFFENISEYIPNYKSCNIYQLISYFNNKYIFGKNGIDDYDYLTEMREYFDVPPLTIFDFDKKYSVVKHNNIFFIKLRFSELKNWGEMLNEIIGMDVQIIEKTIGDENVYSEIYEEFKRTYKLPKEFLEKIKKSSSFNMYNSTSEKIKYIKDWSLNSI